MRYLLLLGRSVMSDSLWPHHHVPDLIGRPNPLKDFLMSSRGEGNGTPLQYSCLENPMDGGAWWAAVHGVTESPTRLSDFTFTFYFHALEEEMAAHSSVLAWRIPGTGEPGGQPSMGSHRVGHDWSDLAAAAALFSLPSPTFTLLFWEQWQMSSGAFVVRRVHNTIWGIIQEGTMKGRIEW